MNGSNSSTYDNIDLSSLSKEDLLRFIAEQNNIIKERDAAIKEQNLKLKAKDEEIDAKNKEINAKAHIEQ